MKFIDIHIHSYTFPQWYIINAETLQSIRYDITTEKIHISSNDINREGYILPSKFDDFITSLLNLRHSEQNVSLLIYGDRETYMEEKQG